MFAHRYFPARYFAPRYWGPATGAAAPTLPGTGLDLSAVADAMVDLMSSFVTIEQRSGDTAWTTVTSNVPCLIVPKVVTVLDPQGRRQDVRRTKVYFHAAVRLGPKRRLRYAEPGTGRVRYLQPTIVRNVAEAGVAWIAECEEFDDER